MMMAGERHRATLWWHGNSSHTRGETLLLTPNAVKSSASNADAGPPTALGRHYPQDVFFVRFLVKTKPNRSKNIKWLI